MRTLKKRATNVKAKQVASGKVTVSFNVGGEYAGHGDKTKIINTEGKTANLTCPCTYRGIKKALQASGFYCEAKHIVLPGSDRKKHRKTKIRETDNAA